MWGAISDAIIAFMEAQFAKYGGFLFGIIIGWFLLTIYHRMVGLRSLIKSYENRLNEKDSHISTLKLIISDRLKQIHVERQHSDFFRRIKKYFKS